MRPKGLTIHPIAVLAMVASALGSIGAAASQAQSASAKAEAPIDLTGYWVSIIDTDWQWRMVTPAKGDHNMIPITPAAQQRLDSWNPVADEAAGEECRAYGAPGLMRIPGRLHITWRDDNTLKVETDAGNQVRVLQFVPSTVPAATDATWQGESAAHWDMATGNKADNNAPKYGSLHVITTHLRPGYLRKNGVPYSAGTVLTEDWDLIKESDGTEWLVILTNVADPAYLQMPWITSLVFKRELDGAKFDPSACSAR